MTKVKAFDLSTLMLDLLQDLPVDVERRKHDKFDVEFERNGQGWWEIVFVVVFVVGVPAKVLAIVSNWFPELFGVLDLASETRIKYGLLAKRHILCVTDEGL